MPSIVSVTVSPASRGDDIDLHARERAPHPRDRHAGADDDALAGERVEHDARAFRILASKRRRRFEHGDVGAEAAKRLRQFETGRAGADDDEMARTIGKLEHGRGGEVRCFGQPRYRRQFRRPAGRDHEAARLDVEAVDGNGLGIAETPDALDNAHSEAIETLARLRRRDRGEHVTHMRAHRGEIDAIARALHPEACAVAIGVGPLGRRDQGLGRQRAGTGACTAHAAVFDQHDIDAEGRCRGGRREPARAGADDADIGTDLLSGFVACFSRLFRHNQPLDLPQSQRRNTHSIAFDGPEGVPYKPRQY